MTILWVSGKDQLWEMASDVNVEAGERKVAQLAVVIEEDAAQRKIQLLIDRTCCEASQHVLCRSIFEFSKTSWVRPSIALLNNWGGLGVGRSGERYVIVLVCVLLEDPGTNFLGVKTLLDTVLWTKVLSNKCKKIFVKKGKRSTNITQLPRNLRVEKCQCVYWLHLTSCSNQIKSNY